jgi:tRNA(Ile)-lysidine synthase
MKRDPVDTLAAALESEGIAGKTVIAACSGGADSTFLLVALSRLRARFGFTLVALTVNHRIRNEAESGADASFVENLANALDPPVECARVDLAAGEVAAVARERGKGIEEAARFLRYRAFADVARARGAARVMTAHNRDDRAETVLMRFLSGASGSALAGIARERGIYLRPLLGISHAEMTAWLGENGVSWREDSTNADDRYLRNRVRRRLVPLLDEAFQGWETGVLGSAARAALDDDLCRSLITARWDRVSTGISCDARAFLSMHPAVRLRFLSDGLILLAPRHRVPSGYLERIANIGEEDLAPRAEEPDGSGRKLDGSGFSFTRSGDRYFWKPDIVQNTKSGYLVYIRSSGAYSLPFGTISVFSEGKSVYIDRCPGSFRFPLTIRTRQIGDTVATASGKRKTLKKLMNEWSVRKSDRDLLPLVETDGAIRAVWGGALGYPDWFVQI